MVLALARDWLGRVRPTYATALKAQSLTPRSLLQDSLVILGERVHFQESLELRRLGSSTSLLRNLMHKKLNGLVSSPVGFQTPISWMKSVKWPNAWPSSHLLLLRPSKRGCMT